MWLWSQKNKDISEFLVFVSVKAAIAWGCLGASLEPFLVLLEADLAGAGVGPDAGWCRCGVGPVSDRFGTGVCRVWGRFGWDRCGAGPAWDPRGAGPVWGRLRWDRFGTGTGPVTVRLVGGLGPTWAWVRLAPALERLGATISDTRI